jgi:hypothetical protein
VQNDDRFRELNAAAWKHIGAGRFDQAELTPRELIDQTNPAEGTAMYRRKLSEASG